MKSSLGMIWYREGVRDLAEKRIEDAFEAFSKAFISRLSGIELTLEFVSFYRYQLASYLAAKPVFTLSLPEGDMISDLIKDSYISFLDAVDSSPFNVTGEGRANLLESVKIVFPFQNDPELLPDVR